MITFMELKIPYEEAKEEFAAIKAGYNWDDNFDLSIQCENCIMPWTVFRLYIKSREKKTQRQIMEFWNKIFYVTWEAFDKAYKDLRIYDTEGIPNYSKKLINTYNKKNKDGKEISQERYNRIMRELRLPENKEKIDPFIWKEEVDRTLLPEEENKVDSDDQDDNNKPDGNNESEEDNEMSDNIMEPGQNPDSYGTTKIRKYQGKLRKKLLKKEKPKCQICDIDIENLLITSHIKDYSKSSNDEKIDIDDVFFLCALHDKLFDNGYFTFDDEGKIIISERIKSTKCFNLLNIDIKSTLKMNRKRKKYMEWHRNNKYKN